jgi:type I restriction enzyme, S subunit
MNSIEKINILEVASIVSGSTPKGVDKFNNSNGEIPFYRVGDMNSFGNEISMNIAAINLTLSNTKFLNLKLCEAGTVIFPKRGGAIFTNKKRVLVKPSAFDLNTMGLVPNDKVNKVYFYYWFNSLDLGQLANGSSVPQLNNNQISPLKIPLPPLDQQKKIAAILDSADAYRQKTKALIEKYDELTQSLFLDMFGDHFNCDKKPLKELVKFSQGQQFGVELQLLEPQDGYTRFLRIVDFTQGDDLRYVPNQNEKYHVKSDDIVIVRYGASAGFVGTNKEGVLANNLFKVNYDRAIFHQLFLYHIFQHGRFIAFIEKEAFGAAMPALSFKVMERFEIPVPPIDLQTQFAKRVKAIEAQKAQAEASLAQAEDLFNSLLQRAFKGKLTS